MTKDEKKRIRLQIIGLLDQCEGCPYQKMTNACVHICPSCPIGKKIQKLGKKLYKHSVKRRIWTKEEDAYIWSNQHLPRKELAKYIGRTERAVKLRLVELRKRGGVTHAS